MEGLLEDTIFVYSSDQGFYLGEHGWFDKRFMYDESYRTPLLISWPGVTEPGSVCSNLVSNLDFAQTFLDAAGSTAPARMQGASLLPLLRAMIKSHGVRVTIIIIMNIPVGTWYIGMKEPMMDAIN